MVSCDDCLIIIMRISTPWKMVFTLKQGPDGAVLTLLGLLTNWWSWTPLPPALAAGLTPCWRFMSDRGSSVMEEHTRLDSFTVSLHSPNGRQISNSRHLCRICLPIGLCRGLSVGFKNHWKLPPVMCTHNVSCVRNFPVYNRISYSHSQQHKCSHVMITTLYHRNDWQFSAPKVPQRLF